MVMFGLPWVWVCSTGLSFGVSWPPALLSSRPTTEARMPSPSTRRCKVCILSANVPLAKAIGRSGRPQQLMEITAFAGGATAGVEGRVTATRRQQRTRQGADLSP